MMSENFPDRIRDQEKQAGHVSKNVALHLPAFFSIKKIYEHKSNHKVVPKKSIDNKAKSCMINRTQTH
jgi:hypothetical protein